MKMFLAGELPVAEVRNGVALLMAKRKPSATDLEAHQVQKPIM